MSFSTRKHRSVLSACTLDQKSLQINRPVPGLLPLLVTMVPLEKVGLVC